MKLVRRFVIVSVLLAGTCLGARIVQAQPAVTDHRTPAGIAFRHMAMLEERHHALAFAWADGIALTLAGKEGVVALGPRLLLEGSRTVGQSERIERFNDLQATLSLAGSAYFTRGALVVPKAKFAEAAALLGDMLADPALPADKLALAKREASVGRRQAEEHPEALANRLFMRLTLGEGPLLRLATADPGSFEAVEIADIEAWRQAVLGRQHLTLASAGPLPPEEAAAHIDRIFAGLPASGHGFSPPPVLRTSGKLIVIEKPAVQTAIVAGGPSGWGSEPDVVQGTVAVRALGASGFQSRLVRAVREGLGAAYGIRASFQQLHPKAFTVVISTVVDNTKAAATIATIRKEYARLLAEGVTEAEIAPIRTKLITESREQLRRSSGAASRIRDLALAGFPRDYLATYESRVGALAAAQINEGIRARFPKEPLTIVMVAPSAEGLGADCVIKTPAELSRCE